MHDRRSRSRMLIGVACGASANFLWGLAFLVPVLLPDTGSAVITLGRYLCYGVASTCVLLALRGAGLGQFRRLGAGGWRTVLLFALTGNLAYYFFLVQGVALAGAPVVTVIIGTLPVTVALYGNWRRREFPFSRLAPSVGLIAVGLVLVNLMEVDWRGVDPGRSLPQQLLGIASAVTSLGLWTWFGVANASFLKAHPQVSPMLWSTLIGVGTLVLTLAALPVLALGGMGLTAELGDGPLLPLVLGSLLLGVVVSWGGTLLWNRASELLPVSLAGQLIVFETVSGLTYVFIATVRVPPVPELAGIAVLLAGVLIGIRRAQAPAANRERPQHATTSSS